MVRFKKRALKFEQPSGKKRRYYSFLTIVLLVCIAIILKSTFDNIVKIVAYQGKILEMQKIQSETANKNENLKKQLSDLDARSYEAIARNNLKMSGEDEVLIIIHEPEDKELKKKTQKKPAKKDK